MPKSLSDRLIDGFVKHLDKAVEPIDPCNIGSEISIFLNELRDEWIPEELHTDFFEGFNSQQQYYHHIRNGGRIS